MKIPKTIKRLCTKCKTHTAQKVHNQKFKGLCKTHTLARGSTTRVRARGQRRGVGNLGRYSKPPGGGKRTGAKGTKKTDLRYTCAVCKKISVQSSGIRAKRVEFV
jgi:large subunit ribosomal protein L44e